ncbi:hypothetical protein [Helicobacter sp. T3_23-1056]
MLISEIVECLKQGVNIEITPLEINNEKYKISCNNGNVTLFTNYKGLDFAICDKKPLSEFVNVEDKQIEALLLEMVNNGKNGKLDSYVSYMLKPRNFENYKEFLANNVLDKGINSTFSKWLFWKTYNGTDYYVYCYASKDSRDSKKFWLNIAENPQQTKNRIFIMSNDLLLDYSNDLEGFFEKVDSKCASYFYNKSLELEEFIN